jgi:hypothetical protein
VVANHIDHKSSSPYTIHTAVLPKPSPINANINAAIDTLCKIVQPEDNNSEYINHLDDDIPCDTDNNFRPVIPVSRESNEPIVEWTDKDKLLRGAFPDLFLFGQGISNQLPTNQHWKHFALYYDSRFDKSVVYSSWIQSTAVCTVYSKLSKNHRKKCRYFI